MALNVPLAVAGLLVLGLGVFHSVLGEVYIVRRLLRRDNLPKLFGGDSFTKLTLRYAWHLLTVLCVAVAILLAWLAVIPLDTNGRVVGWVLVGALGASGAWGVVATRGRHLSWAVLLGAAAFAAFGLA